VNDFEIDRARKTFRLPQTSFRRQCIEIAQGIRRRPIIAPTARTEDWAQDDCFRPDRIFAVVISPIRLFGARPEALVVRYAQLGSRSFRLFGKIKQLYGLARHDRRYCVFVDELGVAIPAQQNAKIVEPSYDTLQLYPVDEEDCQRRLVFPYIIQECVL